MHSSLSPKNSRFLIGCLTAGVAILLFLSSGAAALSCIFGAAFGAWAGILQGKALRQDAERFRNANTASDVRRIMVASREGKRAITLGWLSGVLLLAPAAMSETTVLMVGKFFAGYCTFMLVRDIVAYPSLRDVTSAGPAKPG